ncbi:MAG TPA: nucleotide-binding protein [Hadesarchaea archaeon]|nr:nucleotide-binding protein [Hadesarchaea archaeon]
MLSSLERGIFLQVIVDTSFLMIPGIFGIDVMNELERLLERPCKLLIPSPVVRELRQISERGKPEEKVAARVGLLLVKRGSTVSVKGKADECILKLAGKKRYVVGTTDSALRKELRCIGIPVIYLRQKSHLALDGQIG